ncbi:GTP-binding protein, partial [Strigomonas culicis]
MPLVALAGRGVVGKTSLLRSLFRSPTEVSRSNRVLRRDAMNYFNVGDVFNIVDLPGFGGTSLPWSTLLQHAVLVRNFARVQPSLKMIYYCMDVHYKHGVYVQDIDMLRFLSQEVPNFTIVITKAEQINEQSRSQNFFRMEDIRKELMFNDIQHPVLITSAYRMGGIDTLRFDMVMNALHALPTEHLTYTEAKRLSQRLFSQAEL